MAKLQINERGRAAVAYRLAAVSYTDVPTRRRLDRLFDALKLDELPRDYGARLSAGPAGEWNNDRAPTFEITSAQRDDLIEWLQPSEKMPMGGYLGRLLGPVWDELKDSRDGRPLEAVPEDASA